MRWKGRPLEVAGLFVLAVSACDPSKENQTGEGTAQIEIPQSMREEHEEIHGALEAATEVPGPVGEAGRELAEILQPHFVREEQIALPPLSLLEPLAQGTFEPWMRDVLPMTDSLAAELPKMLREHQAIGAAAARLQEVARVEGSVDVERLARDLQAHARAEEELLYPAAILVGEIVRVRNR